MKVSTENDNNFGYEKITIVVDNIPLKTDGWTSECTFAKYYNKPVMSCLGDAVFTSDAI